MAILVPPGLILEPLGGHFGPSRDQFCCPRIAAPSTSPRNRPRCAVDLAAPSTSPRNRPRRAVDLAAPSISPRRRPRCVEVDQVDEVDKVVYQFGSAVCAKRLNPPRCRSSCRRARKSSEPLRRSSLSCLHDNAGMTLVIPSAGCVSAKSSDRAPVCTGSSYSCKSVVLP